RGDGGSRRRPARPGRWTRLEGRRHPPRPRAAHGGRPRAEPRVRGGSAATRTADRRPRLRLSVVVRGLRAAAAGGDGVRDPGAGFYALKLSHGVDGLGGRRVVSTSRPEAVRAPGARVERVRTAVRLEYGGRGHLARLVWTQTGLRLRLARLRARVLLNLMPE